jgi:hypothetical protein
MSFPTFHSDPLAYRNRVAPEGSTWKRKRKPGSGREPDSPYYHGKKPYRQAPGFLCLRREQNGACRPVRRPRRRPDDLRTIPPGRAEKLQPADVIDRADAHRPDDNGNDISFITPSIEFWSNPAWKWVLRGGTGINIDTGRKSATDTYFTNLAIGRYLTGSDARYFKNLVTHVAVSTLSDVLGRKDHITDVYIAPGFRFGLDKDLNWSVLGAVQVPVSTHHPYDWQPNIALVRSY